MEKPKDELINDVESAVKELKDLNAIWFSRHLPSEDQLNDIEKLEYNLYLDKGLNLGKETLTTEEDVDRVSLTFAQPVANS